MPDRHYRAFVEDARRGGWWAPLLGCDVEDTATAIASVTAIVCGGFS
jgi:hypothetical protein